MHRKRYVGRALIAVAVIVVMALPGGGGVATAATSVTDASPGSLLQQDVNHIRDIGTTGVLAVATNGNQYAQARAGVAALGTNQPVPWGAHTRIGSNTKTFVATVMLQLEAEHKLSLSDTVDHWLPGVIQSHGNQGDHITIRNLLQQTSGLFDYVGDPDFTATLITPEAFQQNRFNNYTLEQLAAVAVSHAPDFAPGAKWEYSNTNYIVAGMIIKAVTGHSWSTEVKNRIIVPLALTETSEPGNNPHLPAPFARGYELFGTDGTLTDTTVDNLSWGGSAGSIISTPADINRFFKALITGRLLPPAQLAEMKTTVPTDPDFQAAFPNAQYGLGIMRIDLPCGGVYWSHGGDTIGYANSNGVTPDGRRSAMVASMTDTLADPVFADNSIRTTNQLVADALCPAGTRSTVSAPTSSSVSATAELQRRLKF